MIESLQIWALQATCTGSDASTAPTIQLGDGFPGIRKKKVCINDCSGVTLESNCRAGPEPGPSPEMIHQCVGSLDWCAAGAEWVTTRTGPDEFQIELSLRDINRDRGTVHPKFELQVVTAGYVY